MRIAGEVVSDFCAGEIVAVAGVAGNGQGELFEAISGETICTDDDAVKIAGVACGQETITQRRRRDAAFVPEERIGHGAVPGFTLSENVVLTHHALGTKVVRKGFINSRAAYDTSLDVIEHFDVRINTPDPEAQSLSGGNLQKFVVGREMSLQPKVLVINQPTWGVDVGAAALIRQALIDLALAGSAVLVISQDLDEIFEIADRISVISRGELSDALFSDDLTPELVGLLMAGAHEVHPNNSAA